MEVITKTSTYELTKESDGFKLIKTAINQGETSFVRIGETFKYHKPEICSNCLCMGDIIHTSPIQNLTEVEKWLNEQFGLCPTCGIKLEVKLKNHKVIEVCPNYVNCHYKKV